jgi:hypothetical protein
MRIFNHILIPSEKPGYSLITYSVGPPSLEVHIRIHMAPYSQPFSQECIHIHKVPFSPLSKERIRNHKNRLELFVPPFISPPFYYVFAQLLN